MNTVRSIALLACTLCALLATGCASRLIESSSTRLKVSNVTGKSVDVSLPKNLDATKLSVTVDPVKGVYSLTADKIVTDASTVIDSAAAAQAQALVSLSNTLNSLIPLIAQMKTAALPALPAAVVSPPPAPAQPPAVAPDEAK